MSKVIISPLLNSLFKRSDKMTKDEATHLVEVLSNIGDEKVHIDLAQSTARKNKGLNYLTIRYRKDGYDSLVPTIKQALADNGWSVVRGKNTGWGGYWIFFNRVEG